jgi:hypothetical protein
MVLSRLYCFLKQCKYEYSYGFGFWKLENVLACQELDVCNV